MLCFNQVKIGALLWHVLDPPSHTPAACLLRLLRVGDAVLNECQIRCTPIAACVTSPVPYPGNIPP